MPPDLLAHEPSIPWIEVASMRDHLAHRYFDTSHAVVKSTVDHDLPELAAAATRLLTLPVTLDTCRCFADARRPSRRLGSAERRVVVASRRRDVHARQHRSRAWADRGQNRLFARTLDKWSSAPWCQLRTDPGGTRARDHPAQGSDLRKRPSG
ncbi:MAG: DUF86 domain-containing protein [Candidatus Nanopelagicales bacterium]